MEQRIRALISGRVQGVGFRPTVYRLAADLELSGFVQNSPAGVVLEVQGQRPDVAEFFRRLQFYPPPQARITGLVREEAPVQPGNGFRIVPSSRSGDLAVGLPPDLATCEACRRELFDPRDRRYLYPFINCTNCGPRFTLITALPYDRPSTSMAAFTLCPQCAAEYSRPQDRRFDAQPNACPACGPALRLLDAGGNTVAGDPLQGAVAGLLQGGILAVKGLGGYHLACAADRPEVIGRLRRRKRRPAKSLAVMFRSLADIQSECRLGEAELAALASPARPIVIVPRQARSSLPRELSPDTPDLGVFLPYTPVHELLLARVSPLVMTSGNRAEEPIALGEEDLAPILGTIADFALAHNRPIVRRCDDSVLKFSGAKPVFIRRSRGFVPEPIDLPWEGPPVLACGAELKNTFCLTRGRQAFLSQHIGDLTDAKTRKFYGEQISDLCRLLAITPEVVVHDLHPDYFSTRYARNSGIRQRVAVQHHRAHVASVLAEQGLAGPVIGVALDGAGYGGDGTVWGGEFFLADAGSCRRLAHFQAYPLPGGDAAVLHPERMALSYLRGELGDGWQAAAAVRLAGLSTSELDFLARMLDRNLQSPLTSSAGRLFDAVAGLLGLGAPVTYEGQAAIRLQTLAEGHPETVDPYGHLWRTGPEMPVLSFGPMIREILDDLGSGASPARVAARFHETVAAGVARACLNLARQEQVADVALSGGVFQNTLLLDRTTKKLQAAGLRVYSHERVPPNDGGLALGQAWLGLSQARNSAHKPPGSGR